MNERQTVEAIAEREGRWWTIELPGLGTTTQARRVKDIEPMAIECAALWLDVPDDRIDLQLDVRVPEAVRRAWDAARARAAEARAAEAEAASLSRGVVASMRADGLTYAEMGSLLGLSAQRVHQLARGRTTA